MKRSKTMIILAAVIVVLVGIVVAEKTVKRHVDQLNTVDETVFAADPDALTQISVKKGADVLTLAKNDDGIWYSTDDETFPIDQDAVSEFLSHFEDVHASFIIDDIDDYSQYGLTSPSAVVTFTTADGDSSVSLGGYSSMDEKRYISTGSSEVYLIDDDLMDVIDTDRDSYMKNDVIPSVDTVTELTVSGDTQVDLVYDPDGVYSYTDDYDYYVVEDGVHYDADPIREANLTGTVTLLKLNDYVSYNASTDDLSQWGLDDPAYTVTVSGTVSDDDGTESDVSYTLYVGKVETPAESEEESPTVTGYVRLGDSEIIYALSDSDYNVISTADRDSLRPGEVLSLDWDTVTAVDISYDTDTCSLTYGLLPEEETEDAGDADASEETDTADSSDSSDTDEESMVWMYNGEEIDILDIENAVNALYINSFTEEEPDKQLELEAVFTLDNADYPTVTVDIYRYDGDNCLVLVNGESVGLMARSLMVDLREAMTAIVLNAE